MRYYFSSDFSAVAAFLWLVMDLNIGSRISVICECKVSRSFSIKVSCLLSAIFAREWSKNFTGSRLIGKAFSLMIFSFRFLWGNKRSNFHCRTWPCILVCHVNFGPSPIQQHNTFLNQYMNTLQKNRFLFLL